MSYTANARLDLGLAISNAVSHQAFHVLMILMIILFTILFCHSIVRLSMRMLRSSTDEERALRSHRRARSRGYVQPEQPIRVVLARDEEIGISGTDDGLEENKGPTPPPPVYGQWRCSVVSLAIALLVRIALTEANRKPIQTFYIGSMWSILPFDRKRQQIPAWVIHQELHIVPRVTP